MPPPSPPPSCKQVGCVFYEGRSLVVDLAAKLTDGAGFPPLAVQTSVKFWAWYRLNGAGVFSATTDMLLGGAVETQTQRVMQRRFTSSPNLQQC